MGGGVEGDSSADWRPGGALAQFGLMSGQLEVHQGALCTAPVSPNLHCRRRRPGPASRAAAGARGSSANTPGPYCFDSCTRPEVMQNVIVRTRGDPLVLSLSTARIRVGTSEGEGPRESSRTRGKTEEGCAGRK